MFYQHKDIHITSFHPSFCTCAPSMETSLAPSHPLQKLIALYTSTHRPGPSSTSITLGYIDTIHHQAQDHSGTHAGPRILTEVIGPYAPGAVYAAHDGSTHAALKTLHPTIKKAPRS